MITYHFIFYTDVPRSYKSTSLDKEKRPFSMANCPIPHENPNYKSELEFLGHSYVIWRMNCSHAQPTPFFTPEHKNTLLEVPLLGSVLLRKICVCGVERRASLTNLILFRWPLFMFAVSVTCLALRKTSCGHVSIRYRHAK